MANRLALRAEAPGLCREDDCVHAARFTHWIPGIMDHEILRLPHRDQARASATPDLTNDQTTAGGCARKVLRSSAGKPGAGLRKVMPARLETDRLECKEFPRFSLSARRFAGAAHRRAAGSGGAR